MKILFLQTQIPYPPVNGGQKRAFSFVWALSRMPFLKLTVAAKCVTSGEFRKIRELENHLGIETIPLGNVQTENECYDVARTLVGYCLPDLIHFDCLSAMNLIPVEVRRDLPFTLNEHNVEWLRMKRETLINKDIPKLTSSELEMWKLREARACAKAQQVFCCSTYDRNMLLEIAPSARISVVPNSLNLCDYYYKSGVINQKAPRFLFTGLLSYPPNAAAIYLLIHKLWPAIKNYYPSATLTIAGQNPLKEQEAYCGNDVRIIANPQDMGPLFQEADFFLVPLQSGSGTRIKILEAMAFGVPVISTLIGAEGLMVQDNTNIFLSNSCDDFVDTIRRAIKHPAIDEIRRSAYALVKQKYSFEVLEGLLLGDFNRIYDQLKKTEESY